MSGWKDDTVEKWRAASVEDLRRKRKGNLFMQIASGIMLLVLGVAALIEPEGKEGLGIAIGLMAFMFASGCFWSTRIWIIDLILGEKTSE